MFRIQKLSMQVCDLDERSLLCCKGKHVQRLTACATSSFRKRSPEQQIVVVPKTGIPYGVSTYQLTEENADFAYRDKRHHSSVVTSIGPQ